MWNETSIFANVAYLIIGLTGIGFSIFSSREKVSPHRHIMDSIHEYELKFSSLKTEKWKAAVS